MHKLIIRNDLNMRRGKMAAQSSHALMKAFLDSFDSLNDGNFLHLSQPSKAQIRQWQASPRVSASLVSDLNDLSEEAHKHTGKALFVEDLGRTEFHGEKTTTCACMVDPDWLLSASPRIPKPFNEPLRAKQVIAIRRDKKLTKEEMCEFASIASVDALLNGLKVSDDFSGYDLQQNSPMAVWLRTAFGKIVVGVPNEDHLNDLVTKARQEDIIVGTSCNDDGNVMAVAIGPDFPENVDALTGGFKLL